MSTKALAILKVETQTTFYEVVECKLLTVKPDEDFSQAHFIITPYGIARGVKITTDVAGRLVSYYVCEEYLPVTLGIAAWFLSNDFQKLANTTTCRRLDKSFSALTTAKLFLETILTKAVKGN